MNFHRISISRICLPALLLLVISGDVMAQGAFVGEWTIVEAHRPDWVSGSASPAIDAAAPTMKGKLDFRATEVLSDGPLACKRSSYQVVSVSPDEIFQGRAGASVKDAALSAGISKRARTLRVTCDQGGTMDFHEADKTLVVLRGDTLYTLMREDQS